MAAKKRDKEAEDQDISIRPMHNSAEKKLAVPDDLEKPPTDDRSTVFTEKRRGSWPNNIEKKLSLLLIPCALVIIALLVALNIPTAFEPPLVLPLMNTLFLGIIPIVIAYVTFKVYTKNGSASVLLIGSGILIFGLGSIVAGWVNPLSGGPNMTVTLHNTCACIGSILILAGAVISHAPAKSGRATGNTGTIAAAYTAIVVFVTILSFATLQGMIPPFFVPGSGPTVLRQVILENATALFALSSVLFMVTYRKGRSDFFFWYSVALALIAIGLLAVFVQPSVGSLIGWVGRSAQYIGFVFALYAVLIARRTATAKGLPLEEIIGNFFVDAEQNYRQLVETATDAIVTIDEDYRVLLWNSAAERMFGYPRDDAIGASFLKLVIDDPYSAVIKNYEQDIFGRDIPALTPEPVEIVGKCKGGALFPVEVTVSRRWQEGRLIQTCILRDITERKRAEEELFKKNEELAAKGEKLKAQFDVLARSDRITRLSEERLIMAQEIGRTGSWEYNVKTGKIWGSAEGFHIYGFPPVAGEIPLDDIEACIPERERVHQALTDLITKGKEYNIECTLKPADGSAQKIIHSIARLEKDELGNPLRVVGVIHDITDIWQIEALRESRDRFEATIASLDDAVFLVDPATRLISECNPAATKIFGYSYEELVGSETRFLHVDQAHVEQFGREAMATYKNPGYYTREFEMRRKDGCVFPTEHFVRPIKDPNGRILYVVSVVRDITERKRAEVALKESESRIRQITDTITSVFYIHDRVSNQFIYVSKAYETIWKRSCQSLIDNPYSFLEAVHPDDRQWLQESIRKEIKDGIYVDTDYRIIQPDGNVHWIRSRNFPIVNETGKTFRVAGVAEDITDLKSADLLLKAAKEYAETLIQTANAMIIGLDSRGTINLFNEAAEEITGYTAAELAGRNWFEVIVPKMQYPRVWEEFNRLLAGGLPKYFENPILTKSGEERYIVWKNSEIRNNEQTVGTISFGIDITERKRAEDALRVSEEKFRLISESSPDHIIIQDRDLRYIWVLNPQLGLTPEDMIGKTDYDILSKEDADQLTLVKRQVLETGKTIHYEPSLSSSLGETEYFEGVYLPKYDNEGKIDGLMGYFRNITKRKQAEQTIRHALAEKEVLLREVHHRVKNSLAGILSLIELQISSLSDPQQIAQFKDLETRIRSMALVHDTLTRTKDLARINVASYTENLTQHLLTAYGTDGKVQCKIDMGDITLPIETATPCGLVMNEIVTNSLKYAFPKTFSCEEIRGEPCTISLTLHSEGNDYLLGIADNGIGMTEGIDVTRSHTLGRFLIRFIVEHQLGGSVEISTVRGTAYTIRFQAPVVKEGNAYEKM